MKSYKRFTIESHQILEQTTANPAKPNTLRRAGRFVGANLRAGIQSARAQKPSTPIPSTSVPANQTSQPSTNVSQPVTQAARTPSTIGQRLTRAGSVAGRIGLGGLVGYDAYEKAQRGDYLGSGISAGAAANVASRRFSQGVQNVSRRAITKPLTSAAVRLGGKPLGKVASRFVPGFQQAYAAKETQERLSNKDYGGAVYSALGGIPGPIGMYAVAKDIERTTPLSKKQQDYKNAIMSGDYGKITKQLASQRTTQTRQQQAQARTPGTVTGSGIRGAGGQTIYSRTPKGATFVSTGAGKQRRTAQLPSTMLLPGGRVGDLAFRGGKPTYLARPSVEATKQNPLQRFARSANLFGYRDRERAQQAQDVSRAAASTRRYYGQLGITAQKQKQLNPSLNVAPKPKSGITRRPAAAPAIPASTPSQGVAQARERLRMRRG